MEEMEDLNFLQESYHEKSKNFSDDRPILFCDKPRVVILEDDQSFALTLKMYLEQKINAEVVVYHTSSDFIESLGSIKADEPFCFLTDISLGAGHDGLFLLDLLTEKKTNFFSLAMTGFASIETAISATKKGVFQYLTKPFELDWLAKLIVDGFAQELKVFIKNEEVGFEQNFSLSSKSIRTNETSKVVLEPVEQSDQFCSMIGRSLPMQQVFERIQKVANSSSTVLISGASGTGKELVVKAIHHLSKRAKHPLISVNCGAIPAELLESELFGHIKGSFTGAIANRKGRFELSEGGTIFLDEIGDMPKTLQVKLLRVLQTRQVEPVGCSSSVPVNCRVIAATLWDLEQAVAQGHFREDLFYRLNVIPIRLPHLSERREDIPLLISHFLRKYVSADQSNLIEFSVKAFDLLLAYDWPGNVRELENMIERLVILKGGQIIMPEDLPAKIYQDNPLTNMNYKTLFQLPDEGIELKTILSEIEDSLIIQAMDRTNGNKNKASQLLGLNRTTLIEKIKKKNLSV